MWTLKMFDTGGKPYVGEGENKLYRQPKHNKRNPLSLKKTKEKKRKKNTPSSSITVSLLARSLLSQSRAFHPRTC
jgi:hypothetical protein